MLSFILQLGYIFNKVDVGRIVIFNVTYVSIGISRFFLLSIAFFAYFQIQFTFILNESTNFLKNIERINLPTDTRVISHICKGRDDSILILYV